jgi:predicted outer membrane repeat protein
MMPQLCVVPAVPGGLARPRRWHVVLLLGLALSLGCVTRSQAATTWTVCASGCNYTSIKAAIAASTTVDGDTLAIGAGTYTEPGIVVNKSLILQGAGAASTRVQAASSLNAANARVFTIPIGVSVTIRKLTIRYGSTSGLGGGVSNSGTLTLTNTTVSGNTAETGGGISNYQGTLALTNTTVSGNTASSDGGGLYSSQGTLTLINSTVSGNTVEAGAGGGLANGGILTLINSTVSGNTSVVNGGGGLFNGGTATLINSTVSGNTAPQDAGGGLNNPGTATLTNSTVSGNTAGLGGGLYNFRGTLTLINSTVSGNSTGSSSGGLHSDGGQIQLTNSIVADNLHGGDCWYYPGSTITSSHGYNLDSDGSCELTASTDLPGVDPLLGPLQDNGGPTLTHALLPSSPAIDAIPWGTNGCGTSLIADQRWQARPQPAGGACDIGAYEVTVPGQALGGWVSGFTPGTVVCQNVTTGQAVTLSSPAVPWDCEAAGLDVTAGQQVALRVRGPVKTGTTDVGGAVVGMAPSGGGCTNLTTGQQVTFQQMKGATAASCVAAGLVVQPGEAVQVRVQGVAE